MMLTKMSFVVTEIKQFIGTMRKTLNFTRIAKPGCYSSLTSFHLFCKWL